MLFSSHAFCLVSQAMLLEISPSKLPPATRWLDGTVVTDAELAQRVRRLSDQSHSTLRPHTPRSSTFHAPLDALSLAAGVQESGWRLCARAARRLLAPPPAFAPSDESCDHPASRARAAWGALLPARVLLLTQASSPSLVSSISRRLDQNHDKLIDQYAAGVVQVEDLE